MERYLKHIREFNRQLSFKNLVVQNVSFVKKGRKPDGIVVIGMGGSGLPGDILKALASEIGLKLPVIVWKDFGLPETNFKKPLYVFVSFSGNTAETISGLEELLGKKRKIEIGVVTTGGALKAIAQKHKLPLVHFRASGLTAREALGYNYHSLIKLLKIWFPFIKSPDLSGRIQPSRFEGTGFSLAKKIKGRIVLVYTDFKNSYLGYIWKVNLNETAKEPAFLNIIPEAAHNEVTALQNKKFKVVTLFLLDSKTPFEVKKKIKAIQKVLTLNKIPVVVLKFQGKTTMEKTWNSVILSHFTSFYLANFNKVKPAETKFVDKLKSLLR